MVNLPDHQARLQKGGKRAADHEAFLQVAQLSGYVSEHSAYHHGETSLQSTIVGLAQSFVGSNNINLLVPSGMCNFLGNLVGAAQNPVCLLQKGPQERH